MAYWLDDGFDTWPEVVRAGKAATGLYVCCGAWISRALTDGFIPAEIAAMYGTPEWVKKLVAVGLWRIEGAGYWDLHYLKMGNPTAEKVRARRAADADRKARWRDKKHQSRRDTTRDSPRSHGVTDAVTPLSPALPPSKEGVGHAPARARGAAHAPDNPNPNPHDRDGPQPTFFDDPVQLAAYHDEIRQLAEQQTRDLVEDLERRRNGAARAREVLAAKTKPKPARHLNGLDALREATTDRPPPEGATIA